MAKHAIDTRAVHAGNPRPKPGEPAIGPVYTATVWASEDSAEYDAILYPRLNNLPNHKQLEAKLCSLEGGEAALITASGMAAISTALLSLLHGGGALGDDRADER